MELKIINIPWIDGIGFDDSELVEFCEIEDVINVGDNFFFHENRPYLTTLLQYRSKVNPSKKSYKKKIDHRALLDEDDKKLYDVLREWRSTRSISIGVPVYNLFDNKQLAKIARLKPETKKALGEIEGIGKGKLDNYSEDVFAIIINQREIKDGK